MRRVATARLPVYQTCHAPAMGASMRPEKRFRVVRGGRPGVQLARQLGADADEPAHSRVRRLGRQRALRASDLRSTLSRPTRGEPAAGEEAAVLCGTTFRSRVFRCRGNRSVRRRLRVYGSRVYAELCRVDQSTRGCNTTSRSLSKWNETYWMRVWAEFSTR